MTHKSAPALTIEADNVPMHPAGVLSVSQSTLNAYHSCYAATASVMKTTHWKLLYNIQRHAVWYLSQTRI